MPVYGLVITLEPDKELERGFLDELRRDPRVTLGDRAGARLALATETGSSLEQHDLHDRLIDHPAVQHLDTTFAELDEPCTHSETETETETEPGNSSVADRT